MMLRLQLRVRAPSSECVPVHDDFDRNVEKETHFAGTHATPLVSCTPIGRCVKS